MGFKRGKLISLQSTYRCYYCCSRHGGKRVKRIGTKRRRRIEKKMWEG